jgi:hypothetical protein
VESPTRYELRPRHQIEDLKNQAPNQLCFAAERRSAAAQQPTFLFHRSRWMRALKPGVSVGLDYRPACLQRPRLGVPAEVQKAARLQAVAQTEARLEVVLRKGAEHSRAVAQTAVRPEVVLRKGAERSRAVALTAARPEVVLRKGDERSRAVAQTAARPEVVLRKGPERSRAVAQTAVRPEVVLPKAGRSRANRRCSPSRQSSSRGSLAIGDRSVDRQTARPQHLSAARHWEPRAQLIRPGA